MTTQSSPTVDENTSQFSQQIVDAIDKASLVLLVSIGHQTGLWDTMAEMPAASSGQIAEAARLNERYVREWLGGTVVGGIVDYDPGANTYMLPRHRAAALTRRAGTANVARIAQYIPMIAEVEQKIVTRFHRGGGLDYSEYPRFFAVRGEQSDEVFDTTLVDVILPLIDGLPDRLAAGIDVADICCGNGHAVNVMASAYSASRVTGIDITDEALQIGRAEAERLGNGNARFVQHDAATLRMTDAYDLITVFDGIHDQADPAAVLTNIYRALRPGGIFLMVDIKASSQLGDNIGKPRATYLYTVSTMHCMSVSLSRPGGAGLGSMWGRQTAVTMLTDVGFGGPQIKEVDGDPLNLYYIARK